MLVSVNVYGQAVGNKDIFTVRIIPGPERLLRWRLLEARVRKVDWAVSVLSEERS